jgi:hypothetical protein
LRLEDEVQADSTEHQEKTATDIENSHWRENRQLWAEYRGSAPDAENIPGVLGMQYVSPGAKRLFLRRAAADATQCRKIIR